MNSRPCHRRTFNERHRCALRVALRIRLPLGARVAIAVIAMLAMPAFTTTAGAHALSANSPTFPGLFKTSTVNLEAGMVYTDTLPLYCS